MANLYVLFEHATGYSLFHTSEFEEIGVALPQVEQSMLDLAKFRSIVELVAFKPFEDSENALENMNSVSEGILHPDLSLFLETNVPKSKKKKKQPVVLGVAEVKLAGAISETLQITCHCGGVVPEVIRGIRTHFHHLISGLDATGASKAQVGLGHSYSRAKIKFNVNLVDNMIIQSISLIDQLDKDINTFSMRVREWYSYHFPELFKLVPQNALYARVVGIIKDRKNMAEDVVEQLEEVLQDSAKVQNILDVIRTSMGMDISAIDLMNIELFCSRIVSLVDYRQHLCEYLKSKMHDIAPNLSTLIGETVGARLISHAGSLTNLAKYPASTVQILGAEKALFRALKTRSNTPKYGLIFHSTFIGRAGKQNKGRISRYLANKCAIASRVDCFSEIPTDVFGKYLKQQVEDRLKFFDTGDPPPKNLDVMTSATAEAAEVQGQILKKRKKKLKKEKKRKQEELNCSTEMAEDAVEKKTKKLKKVEVEEQEDELMNCNDEATEVVKKKKKKKHKEGGMELENCDTELAKSPKKSKKEKKRKQEELNCSSEMMEEA